MAEKKGSKSTSIDPVVLGMLEKAEAEGIPLMVGSLPTFELAGRLYDLGVRSANVKISAEPETN